MFVVYFHYLWSCVFIWYCSHWAQVYWHHKIVGWLGSVHHTSRKSRPSFLFNRWYFTYFVLVLILRCSWYLFGHYNRLVEQWQVECPDTEKYWFFSIYDVMVTEKLMMDLAVFLRFFIIQPKYHNFIVIRFLMQ